MSRDDLTYEDLAIATNELSRVMEGLAAVAGDGESGASRMIAILRRAAESADRQ